MRLLSKAGDGAFHFTTHYENIPSYAILSHTWGSKELTYAQWHDGHRESVDGYDDSKLHFLADRASKDGIGYFWIDTCCIDNKSSAELTEAINSMFRWYSGAQKCYVYMNDVQIKDEEQFRASRWHTRSWTLLELLAPQRVEFYTACGEFLGDKRSLEGLICSTTGIPAEACRGSPLSNFSATERLRWAEKRQATHEEDQVYALMGIFDVSMTTIYGEGRLSAYNRLLSSFRNGNPVLGGSSRSGIRMLMTESAPLRLKTVPFDDGLQYAILSHTWGDDEVTFEDMRAATFEHRRGHKKIKKCCEVAASHGFEYVWADTCCIDKSSSSELQEAICSMYKWYKNASVCYVYLVDYDSDNSDSLTACRWFKRGWTLRKIFDHLPGITYLPMNAEELIAPNHVVFYDQNWNEVGTKQSLCHQIAKITSIDQDVLMSGDLRSRSVADKMSWAASRSTSRVEDVAYSLMGLFDVFMPMLYGEGSRAFIRLQEEIIKQTEDYSIFCWRACSSESGERDIFARSPAEFVPAGRAEFVSSLLAPDVKVNPYHRTSPTFKVSYPWYQSGRFKPPVLTSRGLTLTIPVWIDEKDKRMHSAWISTETDRRLSAKIKPKILCISLKQDAHNRELFSRVNPSEIVERDPDDLRHFKHRTICVSTSSIHQDHVRTPRSGEITILLQGFLNNDDPFYCNLGPGTSREGNKIMFHYQPSLDPYLGNILLAEIRPAKDLGFVILVGQNEKHLVCSIITDNELRSQEELFGSRSTGSGVLSRVLGRSDRAREVVSDTKVATAVLHVARSDLPRTTRHILRISILDRRWTDKDPMMLARDVKARTGATLVRR